MKLKYFALSLSICALIFSLFNLARLHPKPSPPTSETLPVRVDNYNHDLACRVFLGCLLASRGEEGKSPFEPKRLDFDGITLQGNTREGITHYMAMDAKNRSTSEMVLAAIKTLGKNGKLNAYVSCRIYPKSCDLWDTSPRDEKYYVTLTAKPQK